MKTTGLLIIILLAGSAAPAAVLDVGVTEILAPGDTVDSGFALVPRAVVGNVGAVVVSFSVVMRIGSLYAVSVQDTLVGGQRDTVSFSPWTPQTLGPVDVTCYTLLAGDVNPANDTLRKSAFVEPPRARDVGVTRILQPPSTVDSGSIWRPAVEVRNRGRTRATFPVTLKLDTGYTRSVTDTLDAGRTDSVFFQGWQANRVGYIPVSAFTGLADDENPGNDSVNDTIRVRTGLAHDLGAVAVLSPVGQVRAGDTVIPRGLITNLGKSVERVFDVRFRIGTFHRHSATYNYDLLPDSSAVIAFPPWEAVAGSFAVACSTALSVDMNKANDKVLSDVSVQGRESLAVEPDQSSNIGIGESLDFRFYARLATGFGDVVNLAAPASDRFWTFSLLDSAGLRRLSDTDGDSVPDLGLVPPGIRRYFTLRVKSPSSLEGDPAGVVRSLFTVRGVAAGDSSGRDSAVLNLALVPEVTLHNFPNPLQGGTTFFIGLPEDGRIRLEVFDRNGMLMRQVLRPDSVSSAGVHLVTWAGDNAKGTRLAPGTYQYVLTYVHAGRTDRVRNKLVVTEE